MAQIKNYQWYKDHEPWRLKRYRRAANVRRRPKQQEQNRRFREAHPEYAKEWAVKNAEKIRAYNLEYNSRPENIARRRDKKLQRKYALTAIEFMERFLEQRGLCPICERLMVLESHKDTTAVVDHDHTTGQMRAILCNRCNLGLGRFRDDPRLLRAAIAYLEGHEEAVDAVADAE